MGFRQQAGVWRDGDTSPVSHVRWRFLLDPYSELQSGNSVFLTCLSVRPTDRHPPLQIDAFISLPLPLSFLSLADPMVGMDRESTIARGREREEAAAPSSSFDRFQTSWEKRMVGRGRRARREASRAPIENKRTQQQKEHSIEFRLCH